MLSSRFSGLVAIQPRHTLVTRGIYGVIRHPSYLGLLINSLGWSLAFRSGVGVFLTVLLIPRPRESASRSRESGAMCESDMRCNYLQTANTAGSLLHRCALAGASSRCLNVLDRASATESGLLEMREVALVPSSLRQKFASQKMQ